MPRACPVDCYVSEAATNAPAHFLPPSPLSSAPGAGRKREGWGILGAPFCSCFANLRLHAARAWDLSFLFCCANSVSSVIRGSSLGWSACGTILLFWLRLCCSKLFMFDYELNHFIIYFFRLQKPFNFVIFTTSKVTSASLGGFSEECLPQKVTKKHKNIA